MRLFVAATLDSVTRDAVGALIGRLRRHRSFRATSVRWVETQNLHLTLQFLGETSAVQVARLVSALAPAWRQGPFRATLGPASTFPLSGTPRVVWLGVGEGSRELEALGLEVRERLAPLGFAPTRRPDHVHLTIGRVKRAGPPSGTQIREALGAVDVPSSRWLVDRVVLVESRLSSAGASYRVLTEAPLSAALDGPVLLRRGPRSGSPW